LSVRINQEAFLEGVSGVTGGGNVRVNQEVLLLITPVSLQGNKVQIVGGPFQDALGNPLSNGYLIFQLQHDESAGTGQIAGNISVRVPLDANGYIQGTVTGNAIFMWPNNVLTPASSTYLVWLYNASNQPAWDNPQVQSVNSTPSPYSVNAWVPGP
jgi:hypothetical protein